MSGAERITQMSTGAKRLWGALGTALAVGVFALIEASKAHHSKPWVMVVSAVIIAILSGGSFWVYWNVAPRLGRATALAALSLGWGVLLLVIGWMSTTGKEGSSGNLAGYAISGVLIPWLIAGLTIPAAALVRSVKRGVIFYKTRGARAQAKQATKHPRANGAKSTRHSGRYTAPKAGAKH